MQSIKAEIAEPGPVFQGFFRGFGVHLNTLRQSDIEHHKQYGLWLMLNS